MKTKTGIAGFTYKALALAVALFESKVEGAFRFGRWLLVSKIGAAQFRDIVYDNWAKALLWRSSVIASAEIGWPYDGYYRGVLDMAAAVLSSGCCPPQISTAWLLFLPRSVLVLGRQAVLMYCRLWT